MNIPEKWLVKPYFHNRMQSAGWRSSLRDNIYSSYLDPKWSDFFLKTRVRHKNIFILLINKLIRSTPPCNSLLLSFTLLK